MSSSEAVLTTSEALCEAYVKSRIRADFGETRDHHGFMPVPDPEGTLATMRELDQLPDLMEYHEIKNLLNQLNGQRGSRAQFPPTTLQESAEELLFEQLSKHANNHFERYREIYDAVTPLITSERRHTFVDEWGHPVLVFFRENGHHLAVSCEVGHARFGWLTSEMTQSLLVGTWRYGSTRRNEARRAICDEVQASIYRSRMRAEEDVQGAVAISSDALSLWRASHVVLFEGTPQHPLAVLYPATSFRARKIVIPGKKTIPRKKVKGNLEHVLSADGIAPLIVPLLAEEHLRVLCRPETSDVLLCHRSVCGFEPEAGIRLL